jgi:hypothetical protein
MPVSRWRFRCGPDAAGLPYRRKSNTRSSDDFPESGDVRSDGVGAALILLASYDIVIDEASVRKLGEEKNT